MISPVASDRRRFKNNQGFTLVEMLVAIVVLILLSLLLAQVVTMTSQATTETSRALGAAGQPGSCSTAWPRIWRPDRDDRIWGWS